jgi:hypothetical protein
VRPSSNREEANDYRRVVVILNSGWRIIACRDGIQWILQRRSGERHGQPRWVSKKYNRNKRSAEATTSIGLAGEVDPAAREVLDGLPDWFGELP